MSSQAGGTLGDLVERAHAAGRKAYAVATTLEEARSAGAAGADAVSAEGHEAGGWIGDERSFVLLQRLLDASRPVWAGIGLHTAAAAYVAGAAGVVLDSQLLLTLLATRPPRPRPIADRSMEGVRAHHPRRHEPEEKDQADRDQRAAVGRGHAEHETHEHTERDRGHLVVALGRQRPPARGREST
jgi:hypothetical protein